MTRTITIASDVADVVVEQQGDYDANNEIITSLSIFHNCTMTCGWIAAIISVLSFGSFGVPIRYCGHNAHPMIMQSYKTFMCFITCWFIILLNEKITFTYWGILSGIFWVPGATWYVTLSNFYFMFYIYMSECMCVFVFLWSYRIDEHAIFSSD